MKKTILLLVGMLSLFSLASAKIRPPLFSQSFDDAVYGTGLAQHNYVGAGWIHGTVTNSFHNSTHSASNVSGAYVTFTFRGSKLAWYTEKKNTHGIVAISIDGGPETLIDLYSSTEEHLVVYSSPLLNETIHTFKIRATGTKNPASTNYYAIHDAIIVYYNLHSSPSNTAFGAGTFGDVVYDVSTDNTAFGNLALGSITSGSQNTAIGFKALSFVYHGYGNTAVGNLAMEDGANHSYQNTAVGSAAFINSVGFYNTAVGANAEPWGVNTTALGFSAKITASNQVRIGNPDVTSIGGQVSWSTLSDGRFKRDLREDISGLEFVNGLRPVSYRVDKTGLQKFLKIPDSLIHSNLASKEKPIRQTGFVAQEVQALTKKSNYVFSGVDAPKSDTDPYTIRYEEFVVPLVKAVQELAAKNEEQEKQIAARQNQIYQLQNLLGKLEQKNIESSTEIALYQNNPNPFSVDTEINMVLPETAGSASIIVYNLEGKQVKQLLVKGRGKVSTTIFGNELNAGMYIYTLIVDGKSVDTKRMILTK